MMRPMRPESAVRRIAVVTHSTVGSANLDWEGLGFEFRETNSHLKFVWKEGVGWDKGVLVKGEPYVKVGCSTHPRVVRLLCGK